MDFKARKPCKECPFKRSAPRGWLGPDTPQDVIDKVNGEGVYACHMTTAGKSEDHDGLVSIDATGIECCTGSIIYANQCFKRYRDPERQKLQDQMKGSKTKCFKNTQEFMEHHTR